MDNKERISKGLGLIAVSCIFDAIGSFLMGCADFNIIFALLAIAGVIIVFVAYIQQIVGLVKLRNVNKYFKFAFIFVFVSIALGIVSSVLSGYTETELISEIIEIINKYSDIIILLEVLLGAKTELEGIGETELAGKIKQLYMSYVIVMISLNTIKLGFTVGGSLLAEMLTLIGLLLILVAMAANEILVMVYLSRASKKFRE